MAGFLDHVLMQLHLADNLATLLKGTPHSDSDYPRLKRLVTEVYSTTEGNSLVKITDVTVRAVQPMRPLASLESIELTWQQQHPSHMTADLRGCLKGASSEIWADLYASVQLETVLELERGVATHSVTQTSSNTIITELQLLEPENRNYPVYLDIAFAVIEELDLSAGLRAAQRMRAAGAAEPPRPADPLLGRGIRPFAVAVVLPAAQPAGQPDPDTVDSLFAAAGVLPLFASTP